MKRKHEEDEAADKSKPLKRAHEDSCPVDDSVACGTKRKCEEDEAREAPNALVFLDRSSTKDVMENHSEEEHADKPKSPGFSQGEGTFHDVVRCALSYDSFI